MPSPSQIAHPAPSFPMPEPLIRQRNADSWGERYAVLRPSQPGENSPFYSRRKLDEPGGHRLVFVGYAVYTQRMIHHMGFRHHEARACLFIDPDSTPAVQNTVALSLHRPELVLCEGSQFVDRAAWSRIWASKPFRVHGDPSYGEVPPNWVLFKAEIRQLQPSDLPPKPPKPEPLSWPRS